MISNRRHSIQFIDHEIHIFCTYCFIFLSSFSQEITLDSIQGTEQKLNEVIVSSIRVKYNSPFTHSNVSREDLSKKNLGQDLPILLNYLPSVVTTSDAGAGIGYTGIRIRGISAQSTNITINGIPFNDAESHGTYWVNLPDFSSSIESLQVQRGLELQPTALVHLAPA